MIDVLIEIKEMIAIIISLIVGIVVLVQKLVKALRSKSNLNNLICLEKVTLEFVIEAEFFSNYSGTEKREWVKTKVNQFAINNKIIYDEETIDGLIENLVGLSKKVNNKTREGLELLWKHLEIVILKMVLLH